MNDKLVRSIKNVEDNLISINDAADAIGVSQMYLRRMITDKTPAVAGLEEVKLFGRVLYTKDSVEEARIARLSTIEAKEQAKIEKASRVTEKKGRIQEGPTLNELRLTARQMSVPYSNKNKPELIAAIALKEAENAAASGAGESVEAGVDGTVQEQVTFEEILAQ